MPMPTPMPTPMPIQRPCLRLCHACLRMPMAMSDRSPDAGYSLQFAQYMRQACGSSLPGSDGTSQALFSEIIDSS